MKLSNDSCRRSLTPNDLNFIQDALKIGAAKFSGRKRETEQLLDEPKLFNALIEDQGILSVSPKFYFYVLLRHTLNNKSISSPEVADYLGSVLEHAIHSEKIFTQAHPHFYISDAFKEINEADVSERFFQQVKFANLTLLMSGIFSDRISHRETRRGAPSLEYYMSVGKSYYSSASTHRLAQEYALEDVFLTLGNAFDIVCLSLNELSDKLFFLCPPPPSDLLE